MSTPQIRPIVLCIFRQANRILVFEGYDPTRQLNFYRPLGGGIEFGEPSRATVVREMREELHAEICNVRYFGCLENIFTYQGQAGHQIVQLYAADFVDPAFYAQAHPVAFEADGAPINTLWKDLATFSPQAPLYPDGLLELLTIA